MGLRVAKSVASQNKFRGSDRNRGDAGLFESGCEEPGAEAFAKGGEAIEKFSAGGDASVNGDFVEKVASQELQVVAHAKAFKFAELQIVKRSEEHTSELQSPCNLVCRLLLEKKKLSHVHELARDD